MYNVSKKLLTIFLIPILMTFGFKAHGQEVEEIIVTGKAIKESQMAAIEAKRQAVNVADIISADAIGSNKIAKKTKAVLRFAMAIPDRPYSKYCLIMLSGLIYRGYLKHFYLVLFVEIKG